MGHRKRLFNGGEKVREEAELSAAWEERYRKKQSNFTTPLDLSVMVGDAKNKIDLICFIVINLQKWFLSCNLENNYLVKIAIEDV